MPTARTRANRKYNEKAYDQIGITVPKGEKEKIKEAADLVGESVNAFIKTAIQERMGRIEQ